MFDCYFNTISEIAGELVRDKSIFISHSHPSYQRDVELFLNSCIAAFFPYISNEEYSESFEYVKRNSFLSQCFTLLSGILKYEGKKREEAYDIAQEFIKRIPKIYSMLENDVVAAYKGDPACISKDEVVMCYPGFKAVAIYRISHEIYNFGLKILSRVMCEYAHNITGIDIHPGAEIGEYFFIDHGTGVVIGETAVIGDNVKIYQNVTLGAKNFALNEDGTPVKGIKRHPNIGNNVIIYAGATILGGDTFIGDNSVIGANVWLTHSVAEGSIVK